MMVMLVMIITIMMMMINMKDYIKCKDHDDQDDCNLSSVLLTAQIADP